MGVAGVKQAIGDNIGSRPDDPLYFFIFSRLYPFSTFKVTLYSKLYILNPPNFYTVITLVKNGSISIPDRALSLDKIKAKIKEIENDKFYKKWEYKHTHDNTGKLKPSGGLGTWGQYKMGFGSFLILTGLTPTEIIELHAEWRKNQNKENKIAKLLGDDNNVVGTFTDYLINVCEKFIIKIDGKEKTLTRPEYGELTESGKKFKLIQRGMSRGVNSLRHTAVRSFISSKWTQKGSGLPVINIPDYNEVKSSKYKPDFDEAVEIRKVANANERWVFSGTMQLTYRPIELLKLKITQEIIDQIIKIEKNRLPNGEYSKEFDYLPIVVVSHRPSQKGKGGSTIGIRTSAFGFEAYDDFKQFFARKNGGVITDWQALLGRPLFEGNNGTPYNMQKFNIAYTRPAKIIGLDEKAKRRGETLSIYGARSLGQTAWELNAKMKEIKDWVSGHSLQGVGANYFTEWRVKREYMRGLYYLNPTMGREEHARNLEETITNTADDLATIKAENVSLREEIRDIRRDLAGSTAAAFKKEVSEDTLVPPEILDLIKSQGETIEQLKEEIATIKAT